MRFACKHCICALFDRVNPMHRQMLAIVLSVAVAGFTAAPPARGMATSVDDPMSAAVGDLCSSDVALIGEGGNHGDGRSLAFKAALVQRLVEQCHFDAIVFEASSYDFLEIDRRLSQGEPVTRAMLSSAVGGLWNRNDEIQPLITWMHESLVAGRVQLGGMDDQLGSAGAFYSIAGMPTELGGLLASDRGDACKGVMRQLIYGQLGTSPAEQAPLVACLSEIRHAVEAMPEGRDRDTRLQNLANIDRYVSRQGMDSAAYIEGRSHSMWLNYRWWVDNRFPRGSRVIVWGATAHLSRKARSFPPFATTTNFGSYIDRTYGDRAFFLGFGAASGTYMEGGQVRDRPRAAPESLEGVALAGSGADLVYLGQADLQRLGQRSATVFSPVPVVAPWSEIVDGLIVFREERAPTRSPPGQTRENSGL